MSCHPLGRWDSLKIPGTFVEEGNSAEGHRKHGSMKGREGREGRNGCIEGNNGIRDEEGNVGMREYGNMGRWA